MCDSNLIGKHFEEKGLVLNVREKFYDGKKLNEKEFDIASKEVGSLNVVGRESINFCLERNLLKEEEIKTVKNIPFAIVVFIR